MQIVGSCAQVTLIRDTYSNRHVYDGHKEYSSKGFQSVDRIQLSETAPATNRYIMASAAQNQTPKWTLSSLVIALATTLACLTSIQMTGKLSLPVASSTHSFAYIMIIVNLTLPLVALQPPSSSTNDNRRIRAHGITTTKRRGASSTEAARSERNRR